jgi:hypothetical protein
MTVTLGGKLSCLLALIVAGLWLAIGLGSPNLPSFAEGWIGNALYILSFPLGWLSGMFSGGHASGRGRLVGYILLMIPNVLLWGYTASSLKNGIRLLAGHTRSKPVERAH